jgi:hypothetical protein
MALQNIIDENLIVHYYYYLREGLADLRCAVLISNTAQSSYRVYSCLVFLVSIASRSRSYDSSKSS